MTSLRYAVGMLCMAAIISAASPDYRKSPGYAAYEQANAQFSARRFDASLESVREALRLDPALLPALTLRARLAMATNDHDAAEQALVAAVRVAPDSPYAHFLLGFHYYNRSDFSRAVKELNDARRLSPNDSQPHVYLGLTHESLGDNQRAVEHYRRAIALEQSSGKLQSETLLTLARLLMLTGDIDECGRLIRRAVQIDAESRDAQYELARFLLKDGDPAGAAAAAEKALALPPAGIADRHILYVLVRAHRLAGNENRAAEHAKSLRTHDR